MKSIRVCTILLSLVGIALLAQLGLDYYSEAANFQGLHPAVVLAAVVALVVATAISVTNFEE